MSLAATIEDFFRSGHAAAATADPTQLHAFRLAAKRLRYTLEFLAPKQSKPRLHRLRLVQRELGAMNDSLVAARFLRQLPSRSPQARPIPRVLERDAQAHIEAFRHLWRRRFPESEEAAWLTWARHLER